MEPNTLKSDYLALIQLTKALIEESENQKNELSSSFEEKRSWILSDSETFNYFKEEAIKMNKKNVHQNKAQNKVHENHSPPPSQSSIQTPIPTQIVYQPHSSSKPAAKTYENQEALPQKKPEIIKTETIKPETKTAPPSSFFELEPLISGQKQDLNDIRKILEQLSPEELLPEQTLHHLAIKNNPEILIISDNQEELSLLFLKELEKSLTITLGITKTISYNKFILNNNFNKIKLIINIENENLIDSEKNILNLPSLKILMNEPKKKRELFQKIKHAFIS